MKPILLFGIVSVLVVLSGCGNETEGVSTSDAPRHELALEKVEVREFHNVVWLPGQVVASQRISIASKVSGYLQTVKVNEGDHVSAGQVLAEIDGNSVESAITMAQAGVDSARADLEDARSDVKRLQRLSKTQHLAEDELRNAEVREANARAQLQKALAELKMHEADRVYTKLSSPEDAVIVERLADKGEFVGNGQTILQLESLSLHEIEVFAPVSLAKTIAIGQAITIRTDGTVQHPLNVLAVVPSADPVTRQVKIRLDASSIAATPGAYAEAQLITEEYSAVAVPLKAVINRAGIPGVFIVGNDDIARFRSIRLGRVQDGHQEVIVGLDSGTLIISEPTAQLRDGDRVSRQ